MRCSSPTQRPSQKALWRRNQHTLRRKNKAGGAAPGGREGSTPGWGGGLRGHAPLCRDTNSPRLGGGEHTTWEGGSLRLSNGSEPPPPTSAGQDSEWSLWAGQAGDQRSPRDPLLAAQATPAPFAFITGKTAFLFHAARKLQASV